MHIFLKPYKNLSFFHGNNSLFYFNKGIWIETNIHVISTQRTNIYCISNIFSPSVLPLSRLYNAVSASAAVKERPKSSCSARKLGRLERRLPAGSGRRARKNRPFPSEEGAETRRTLLARATRRARSRPIPGLVAAELIPVREVCTNDSISDARSRNLSVAEFVLSTSVGVAELSARATGEGREPVRKVDERARRGCSRQCVPVKTRDSGRARSLARSSTCSRYTWRTQTSARSRVFRAHRARRYSRRVAQRARTIA